MMGRKGKNKAGAALLALVAGAGLLLLQACGGMNREVVTVREVSKEVVTVSKAGPDLYKGLKREDVARLEDLKKTIHQKEGGDEALTNLLAKTPSYTIQEYLAKHPNSRELGQDYKIGGYDVLSITVYEEKDLTIESIRVSADGYISFPLIGRFRIADMNTSEVEKLIALKLAEGQYLLDAHVAVMVKQYEGRKYSVLGAVKSPGSYSLQAQERLLDGISKAAGIDETEGEKRDAMIIRTLNPGRDNESKFVIHFDLQGLLKGSDQISNIYLADQDVLYVPKSDNFYIIGEVKNPGIYAFNKKDITIVEAISMAGGFTRIAARNKTRIVRVEGGSERIYDVNVDAITQAGKMIQAVPIKPNDLIVVPESFF